MRGGVAAIASPKINFCNDVIAEKYLPDHIIRLPSTPDQVREMQGKWNSIRTKENAHYRFLFKNCSTIVARVLRAGGYSANLWRDHSMLWTPNKIKEFALGAGGKLMKWSEFWAELEKAGVTYNDFGNLKVARDKRFCSTGATCKN